MFKNGNRVETLQNKSNKIFNVFTQTLQDLNSVNTEIDEEVKERDDEISKLQAEKESLNTTRQANQKMAGKISAFINE